VTKDGALVDQYIDLIGISSGQGGASYAGTAFYSLLTESFDSGQERRYQQMLEVDFIYEDSGYNQALVNPEGDPHRFQTDLAAAAGQ